MSAQCPETCILLVSLGGRGREAGNCDSEAGWRTRCPKAPPSGDVEVVRSIGEHSSTREFFSTRGFFAPLWVVVYPPFYLYLCGIQAAILDVGQTEVF